MTMGSTPAVHNLSLNPTDATFANVDSVIDKHLSHDKTRYEEWQKTVKYQADQQLAMAVLSQIAQQFFAEKSLQAALDGAEKQFNIANRQMLIAEEEYARYKLRFFCVEHALAQEACDAFDENPDYETAVTRATRNTRLAFSPQYKNVIRNRARYCRCDNDKDYCDLATQEAMATVAARNFAFESEDARAIMRRTTYDNFRFKVATFGRGIQTDQLNTYAGAMPTAVQAIQQATQARIDRNAIWAGGINSVLQAYFSPRIANPEAFGGGFNSSYGNSQARPYAGYNTGDNGMGGSWGYSSGGSM